MVLCGKLALSTFAKSGMGDFFIRFPVEVNVLFFAR